MVKRFLEDRGSFSSVERRCRCDSAYVLPYLRSGCVILVIRRSDFLVFSSMKGSVRGMAAESIYKERCIAVDDGGSWAKYMSISGSPDDEYDIISEECLLTVDENREGQAAAFGDDIAIGCLATEFKREIFVPLETNKIDERARKLVFIPRSTSLLMAASKQSDPPSSSTSSPPKSHVFPNQALDQVSTNA
ncbi:hypothetical protein CK203_081958 [Vitis vinifera]|uniref:Uncharacterized protein n=1 Tax=Vitis vinifera TaxID=29760 RepID=A0A438DX08_VITVI|nr:hypothetical protein CK203_081958 [Vitis vinifera]